MVKSGQVDGLLLELDTIILRQTSVCHTCDTSIFTTRVEFLHEELLDGDLSSKVSVFGKIGDAETALSEDFLYFVWPST